MTRTLRLSDAEWDALNAKRVKAPRTADATKAQSDPWPIVLRDQIVSEGLPEPYREHVFHAVRGWRLDLGWPDIKFAVEVDGMVHRIKGRFLADIERHNSLVMAGWKYLRVTPAMVKDGSALMLVKAFLVRAD